ncbi:hypothetical protein [Clostridium perfringens]|nr:hypothetical protein [Clostridium perfringens]
MRTTMGEAYEILNKALFERISSLDSEKDSVIVCDPFDKKGMEKSNIF